MRFDACRGIQGAGSVSNLLLENILRNQLKKSTAFVTAGANISSAENVQTAIQKLKTSNTMAVKDQQAIYDDYGDVPGADY